MENMELLTLMLDTDQVEHLIYLRGQENKGLGWSEDGTEPSNQAFGAHTFKLLELIGKDVAIQPIEVFGSWVIQGTHQQLEDIKSKITGTEFVVTPSED